MLSGTSVYYRAAAQTTEADAVGNTTVFQFNGLYETQRKVYQGNQLGTLLQTVDTCYNGDAWPCNGATFAPPFSQIAAFTTLGSGGLVSKSVATYNAYGLPTEVDDHDFGSGVSGSLLRKTTTTYNTSLGPIVDHPASTQVYDGHGNLFAQTFFGYDETQVAATSGTPQHTTVAGSRGNLTSVKQWVSGTSFLTRLYSYYDTGNVYQATDVNNAVTTYAYGACGNSFLTSTTFPLALSTSQTWNCNGGVVASSTNMNGNVTTTTYNDANYWRPTMVTDALTDATHGPVQYTYSTSPTPSVEVAQVQKIIATVDQTQIADGLGRPWITQTRQAQGSSTFDSVETDYDALGRPSRVTVPYSATARQTTPTPQAATTLTYDALGRPLKTIDGGGGYTQYQYTQNDVLVTRGPAPAGENLKTRQLQYDGLGRLISVCEVTTGSETGQCYQTAAATGYLTKYSYDPLGNLLNVSENSLQTRTYAYDGLSRMTSSADPETKNVAGTTTYDSDLTCGSSSGDAVRTTDAAGNVVCSSFDKLHRVTSRTYPSGPYALTTSQKIYVYDSATVNGVAMTYSKGLLAEAYTTMSNSTITDLGFSYDIRGEQDGVYETTPHSGGYYWVHALSRDYDGTVLQTISTPAAIANIFVSRDWEGRTHQLYGPDSNAFAGAAIYLLAYTPAGALRGINFDWNSGDSFTYDPLTGRMIQYQYWLNFSSKTAVVGNLT